MRLAAVDLNGEHDWAVRSWNEEDGVARPTLVDGGRGSVAVRHEARSEHWIAGEEALLSAIGLGGGWGGDGAPHLRRAIAAALSSDGDADAIAAAVGVLAGRAARIVVLTDSVSPGLPSAARLAPRLGARVASAPRAEILRGGRDLPVLAAARGRVVLERPGSAPVIAPWDGTLSDVVAARVEALASADPELDPDLLRRQLRGLWRGGTSERIGSGVLRMNLGGRFRPVPKIADPPAPASPLPGAIARGLASAPAALLWSPCGEAAARLAVAVAVAAPGLAVEIARPEAGARAALDRMAAPGGFLALSKP
jgi:hypothetical protein